MAEKSTSVEIANSKFDIAEVGAWITDNIGLTLLLVFIGFMFHVFRPGGFAEKFLEYRTRRMELDAKQLDDARALADIISRKFDRDDPFLPFDDAGKKDK